MIVESVISLAIAIHADAETEHLEFKEAIFPQLFEKLHWFF